jgi:hypothetical protein
MTLAGLVIYGVVTATGFAAFAWLRSATAKVPAPAGAPAEGFQEIMSDDGLLRDRRVSPLHSKRCRLGSLPDEGGDFFGGVALGPIAPSKKFSHSW